MKRILVILIFVYLKTSAQMPFDSIIPTFGGIKDGKLERDIINRTDSLVLYFNKATLVNSRVVSFAVVPDILGTDVECLNTSNKISPAQRKWINEVPLLGKFIIENISVRINDDTVKLKTYIKIVIDGPKACIFNFIDYYSTQTIFLNNDTLCPRKVGLYNLSGIVSTTKKIFLTNDYLLISNPDSYSQDIDNYAKIIKYSCTVHKTSGQDTTFNIASDMITKPIKKYIKTSKYISYIKFDNIEAQCMNGNIMKVGVLFLKIL